MLENKYKQITISEHISLYDKIISKDNFLRKLKENIDFSFVNKLVEKEYSEKYGRPAKEPEMMYKLLFLEIKDSLSDREVIRRAETDMAYKYFLDLNPEDNVPSYSLLSVFRNTKIKDERILEEMLQETVKQAIEKGIIKSNSIIVDATHTNSKNIKKTPTQILRELSKNLRKEIYRNEPEIKEVFPTKPEETASLEEEIEYTKKLATAIKEKITENTNEKVKRKYKKLEEMLTEEKLEKIQSSIDKDASLIFDNQFWSTGPLLIIARKQIQFGRNCVLSWNISVMDHDAHDIYHGGVLTNTPQPVLFDNHCWIGFNSTILKGSIIPENSVIAANSVITKADFEKNSVIAGVPGMTIKNGVNWN